VNWWLLLPALASCVLVVALLGRYNAAQAARDWDALAPAARAEAPVEALARQFEGDRSVYTHLFLSASRERRVDPRRAVELLEITREFVEGAAPDRLERLKVMARFARMASALVPVPPVLPTGFKLRSLWSIGAIATVVHHLLVSASERLWWRCVVLSFGVRAVLGALRRSDDSVQRTPEMERAWTVFEHALSDWDLLDAEQVATLAVLVRSSLLAERTRALTPPQTL
jgi:hypothetical protein